MLFVARAALQGPSSLFRSNISVRSFTAVLGLSESANFMRCLPWGWFLQGHSKTTSRSEPSVGRLLCSSPMVRYQLFARVAAYSDLALSGLSMTASKLNATYGG